MPDRIIRQSIRTSPTIDVLSFQAESMFYRLMTVADDFGRFDADPRILFSTCFPLKVDRLKVTQVANWFDELVLSGLAKRYEISGRTYGFLVNWAKYQRGRAKDSRFPEPPDDHHESLSDDTESQHLTEDSNTSENMYDFDNISCQPTTIVPDIRYSIIEETIIEKETDGSSIELSSETSADADSLDDPEPTLEEPYSIDEVVDHWNTLCEKTGLSTKSARGRQNPAFRKKIKLRLQENPERQIWDTVFALVPKSSFLCGEKGWKLSLDWLVENSEHFILVYEGKYNNGARASPSRQRAQNSPTHDGIQAWLEEQERKREVTGEA